MTRIQRLRRGRAGDLAAHSASVHRLLPARPMRDGRIAQLMYTRSARSSFVAFAPLLVFALFVVAYAWYARAAWAGVALTPPVVLITLAKASVELLAAWYGIGFACTAVAFLCVRSPREARGASAPPRDGDDAPPVGIVYLCCDDADARALRSLTILEYPGIVHVVIHDDSKTAAGRRIADELAGELGATTPFSVQLLRRPDRSGGKPAAVNYALDHAGHLFDFFLLCDNDSTVLDPLTLQRATPHLEDPAVAVVQLRPRAIELPGMCGINRLLGASIAAFHAFLLPCARFGWMPFIGHNALLRTRAVREVGGLTPGCFADDLDLTVRLNEAGHRVAYAADIEMGETHPPSYVAFRRRCYKWAYGCMQILKAHAWRVLRSNEFGIAEKLSFFHFAGFYALQAVLLVYLVVAFVLAPLVLPHVVGVDLRASMITGSTIVVLIFLPMLAYRLKEGRDSRWGATLLACGLVYGGADFSVARGVWDGLRGRQQPWTPTNADVGETELSLVIVEACFGLVLLITALVRSPALLYLPSSYLFAGKFLFGPALSLLYHDVKPSTAADPLLRSADAAVDMGSA